MLLLYLQARQTETKNSKYCCALTPMATKNTVKLYSVGTSTTTQEKLERGI